LIGPSPENFTPSTIGPDIRTQDDQANTCDMPICIECRYPVSALYTTYSKADDKALGKGVRLTQCPRCKRFADKYVEHDFVVLFIDLVLIKPQVCLTLFRSVKMGRRISYLHLSVAILSKPKTRCPSLSIPQHRLFHMVVITVDRNRTSVDTCSGISTSTLQPSRSRR
jgi:hypothetical protein